jgi:hypothetical protein
MFKIQLHELMRTFPVILMLINLKMVIICVTSLDDPGNVFACNYLLCDLDLALVIYFYSYFFFHLSLTSLYSVYFYFFLTFCFVCNFLFLLTARPGARITDG